MSYETRNQRNIKSPADLTAGDFFRIYIQFNFIR